MPRLSASEWVSLYRTTQKARMRCYDSHSQEPACAKRARPCQMLRFGFAVGSRFGFTAGSRFGFATDSRFGLENMVLIIFFSFISPSLYRSIKRGSNNMLILSINDQFSQPSQLVCMAASYFSFAPVGQLIGQSVQKFSREAQLGTFRVMPLRRSENTASGR